MESGKDVSEGGAKYNSYGGTATGLATTADSLTALKYMVFDKKLISGKEYLDAFLKTWEGYEPLRQKILNEVPHYGNADPYDRRRNEVCDCLYITFKSVLNAPLQGVQVRHLRRVDLSCREITWATRTDERQARRLRTPPVPPRQRRQRTNRRVYFLHQL
jgi:hypothetical protein